MPSPVPQVKLPLTRLVDVGLNLSASAQGGGSLSFQLVSAPLQPGMDFIDDDFIDNDFYQ